jgi:hypothetical protein
VVELFFEKIMVITDLRFTFCRVAKQWKADATRPRERSCFFAPGNDPNGPAVSIDDFCALMLDKDDPHPNRSSARNRDRRECAETRA